MNTNRFDEDGNIGIYKPTGERVCILWTEPDVINEWVTWYKVVDTDGREWWAEGDNILEDL